MNTKNIFSALCQNTQDQELQSQKLQCYQQTKAFTLIELIVVISILAILWTIGFLSIQNYSSKSRDSVRIENASLITKALEVYQVTAGSYPMPDTVYGTWQINGVTVSKVGYIGDLVAPLVKLDTAPTDPLSGSKYIYGVDINSRQYQIATVTENSYAMNSRNLSDDRYTDNNFPNLSNLQPFPQIELIPTVYAAGNYESRISGNYSWIIKVGNTLYNPPSLIIATTNAGTVDLTSTATRFVTHKGTNLPYLVSGAVQGTETPTETLTKVGSTASSLTWITLTNWKTESGSLKTSLGYPIEKIGIAYYGTTKYYTEVVSGNVGLETSPVTQPVTPPITPETPPVTPICSDIIQNGTETGVDCGGTCSACVSTTFTLSQATITAGTPITISDTCTTHPTGYISSNTSVATIAGTTVTTLTAGTTNITPTGGNCTDTVAKILTVTVAPVADWTTIDTSCTKSNVSVGTQVWAGCNSTIGTLAINYNNGACYNYDPTSNTNIWGSACYGTSTKENWSGISASALKTQGYAGPGVSDNIYGALYQYDQMNSGSCLGTGIAGSNTSCPCKSGYHVPTQTEWDTLETALGCSSPNKLTGDAAGWECMTNTSDTTNGLGWNSTNPNSLKNKLWLTLAGYCYGGSCYARGYYGSYWSSSVYSPSPTNSWRRYLDSTNAAVYRRTSAQSNAFSVRCLKD